MVDVINNFSISHDIFYHACVSSAIFVTLPLYRCGLLTMRMGKRSISTQLGGMPSTYLAKMLLRELYPAEQAEQLGQAIAAARRRVGWK